MTRHKTASTASTHSAFGLGSPISIGAGMGLIAGLLLGNLVLGLLGGAAAGTLVGSVVELYRRPSAAPHIGQSAKPISLRWLIGSLIFLGVSALFGGLVLVGSPSGAWLHMPLSVLQYSPFTDFLIPGVILGTVFGLGSLGAVLALWRRPAWSPGTALTRFTGRHWAWSAALALGLGLGLVIWITTQILMVRGVDGLQVLYGSLGVLIVVLACLPGVRGYLAQNAGQAPLRRPM